MFKEKPWQNPEETRALWVVRSQIKKKADIFEVLNKMQEYQLNTAIVQVRGLADTLYPSKIETLADEIDEDLKDPFGFFLEEANKRNIAVEAWFNVNMLSKPDFLKDYSKADQHLVVKKPNWVLKDQEGKSMLSYKQDELEADWMDGAYANPALKEWRLYFLNLVTEVQKNYPSITGVHLDFIRYPYAKEGGKNFGLDDLHLHALNEVFSLEKQDYIEFPHYQKALDVMKLYQMNRFVREISKKVKSNNAKHLVTAAVWAHKQKTLENVYQDWPFWLKKGFLDHAYMMIYITDSEVHDTRMEEFYDESYMNQVVVGLGLYRNPKASVIQHQIDSSRAVGAKGFCLFSARNLIEKEMEQKLPVRVLKRSIVGDYQ